MKKSYFLFLLFFVFIGSMNVTAQVAVTATNGTLSASYTTLKAAFDAINLGVHKGDITIDLNANTTETAPAVLNSGDADPASYTSVLIEPVVDGVSISGSPGAGRGVIELNGADNVFIIGDNPLTPGSNRNLTINNNSTATLAASAVIRIATRPSVVPSADNNFILNCILNGNVTAGNAGAITSATSSSNISFGIYCGGNAGTSSTTAPTAITTTPEAASTGTTIDNLVIDNNEINRCARGIAFNGAVTTVSASLTITNNTIGAAAVLGSYPYTTPSTTVYSKGIWVAGTDAVAINSNTIRNVISYVATSITGIELASPIGSNLIDISGNTVTGIVNNNNSSGDAFGILIGAASNKFTIATNTIATVQNGSSTSVAGIKINTTGAAAGISQNNISGVYSRSTGGWGAFGVHLSSAANGAEINNNFIYDILNVGNLSFGTDLGTSGIYIASGSGHRIYHNSVHLSGANAGTGTNSMACLSVLSNTSTGLDIRNNIFSNVATGGSASDAHVCLYFPFAASAGLGYTINNNAYYTGSVAGKSGIAFTGANTYGGGTFHTVADFNALSTTAPAGNFRIYSAGTGVGSNDFASFASTAAAPFTSATDLHIPAATLTRLESGAVPVGITADYDNAARSGTTPDIGADEFAGTPQDLTPPLITYTPLAGTCVTGNRTLTATITDASGVGTGANLPRLFWRINAGGYAAAAAPTVAGNNYTFTFGAGAIVGDVVSYYIVAQDNASTPNVISQPSAGAGPFTANPPATGTPPSTPDSYAVQNNLAAGTYTVGVSGTYPTLTAAVTAYNNSCLNGAVVFNLIDATYPSETFPIVIGNPAASAINTLRIKPNTSASITGTSDIALIKLNGADYVTIDGSNSGGSDQNLTLTNNDPGTSSAVIWVASASVSNGATNNGVRNCIISGNGSNTTFGGIISSSGASIGSVAEAANSNNTYQNNNISTAQYGIAVVGPTGRENNTVINNNKIGSSTLANKMGFRALFISNQTAVVVSNNDISGVTSAVGSSTSVPAGITVRGEIAGGNIFNNIIHDVENTNTQAWTAHGITLQASSLTSGLTIYNNFIYDITGDGYTPNIQDNGHGIGILGGGGYNIYFNSVNLNTDQASAGNSAAIFIDNRTAAGTTPVNLNIRNNIFSNQQTSASGTRYSIYSSAPASSFTNINYNDYYTTGSTLGFIGSVRNNLAAWQTGTGADVNSVSVDPVFVSGTDLHLRTAAPSSTLDGQATPIAGITLDIDGNGRNLTTPDIGADEFTPVNCSGIITGGTITASQTNVCVSAGIVFASTGFTTGSGMTYAWESSPDGISSWTPVGGQTNPSGATITISTTGYYRLAATCSFTATTGNSNIIQVTVTSPSIVSSAGGSVCGLGSIGLTATGSAGTTVNWYANPTGGLPLLSGSTNYTTPVINTTTTYYAEAVSGSSVGSVGPASPTAQGGTIGTQTISWDVGFDVIQATTLLSVDVFPLSSGANGTLNVYNSANTILISVPYTTTVSGGATAQTIPINLALVPGTGYYIEDPNFSLPGSGLSRNTSGATYPYTSAAINITGNGFDPDYFMCYYNWQFSSGCASAPRTAVVATVSAPPAFTAPIASPTAVCAGGSSNITALDADYSTYSWLPATGLSNAAIANPVATPASTTTYTVTVGNGTCTTSGEVTITVNPIPGALSITPPNPAVCSGFTQSLVANGGAGEFFRERFEVFPVSKFTVTGTGVTASQNLTYYQEGSSSVRLTHGDNISNVSPAAYEVSNAIDLSQYSNSVLTFRHICALENNGSSDWDFGYVEYSTDGGTAWTPFPTASYTGTGSLRNGVVCFEKTSYSDWNTQFTGESSTPGASPATGLWKTETINLSAWQSSTQFKFRFRIKSDVNTIYYGWLIDDVRINGQASITWTPTTELFTNAGATIAYTGTNNPTVYVKPTATREYTATASFGSCSVEAKVTPVVTANPISLTIAANPGTTICGADTVKFTITAQNIQGSSNVLYNWQVNGVTLTGGATGGSSVGTTVTVASTANLYVGMQVTVSAGTGAFQADTRITSILNANQFTVNVAPVIALSGATITATASGKTVTSIDIWSLVNGDVVTCSMTVAGVTCVVPITGTVTSNAVGPFTVGANTPASVSISPSPTTTICAGAATTFTATPVNGGINPTYEWFINGVSQGAPSTSNSFTTSALTNGQVVTCRMASNATNCPLPLKPISAGTTVTVNPSFPVSVSLAADPGTSVCAGTSVLFTATPTNGGGSPLYEFFVNSVSQGAPSATPTFNLVSPADLDVVEVVLTSSIASCAPGNPATSPALNMNITTLPVSVHLTPNVPVCAGIPVTYTATPTNGGGSPLYEFFVNNISQGAPSATATLNHTPADGDILRVEVQSSLGACAVPNPADTSFTQVVYANPTATISSTGTAVCTGAPVLFTASATAGSGTISTYQWVETAPLVNVGANVPTHVSSTPGKSYSVTVTNSNGCFITSNVIGPLTNGSLGAMNGTYTIGVVTATASAASVGTTINVASTAGLIVGQSVAVTSGAATGVFAAGTTVASITNATQFVVSAVPTTALTAGATITGATCSNYISFASAIADLNNRSINANCLFDVAAGFVEHITAQLALGNATLSTASNTWSIIFQKNGVGANPLIQTAFAGTTTSNVGADGMWSLRGINNVTIDGIDLTDNNTASTTTMMEFGYGLFKLSVTDGAQNNTIQNCVITLNRNNNAVVGAVMTEGSTGIIVANSVATTPNAAIVPTAASGANSSNRFYRNTIQNCNIGIALRGYSVQSVGDTGNDIGGSSGTDGNTITNFGGGGTIQSMGIRITNQWNANVSYNTITGNSHAGIMKGIWGEAGTSASITINNNTVTVVGGGSTQAVNGIENAIGATAAANTVTINNNIVSGSYPTATTGAFTAISNSATAANVNMNGNTVQNITLANSGAGTTLFTGIGNSAVIPGVLRINNNTIVNNTKTSSATGATNNMTLLASGNPAAASTIEINDNTISGNRVVGGSNTVTLNCIAGGGANGSTLTSSGNSIFNNAVTGMAGTSIATLYGYSNGSSTTNETLDNNNVNNLFVTGTSSGLHVIGGIRYNTLNTAIRTVNNNTIYNLYSNAGSSAVITGIISGAVASLTCYNNVIYNLFPGQNGTSASIAKGIAISGGAAGTTWDLSNNMISIDLSLAAAATSSVAANAVLTGVDAVRGIEMTTAAATSNLNLYYNSIRLAGAGAGNFGSSGIYHTVSGTATTAALNLRNTLIDNECIPSGTGRTVAYRRSATALNNYAATSNNNLFYAGVPAANRLIFFDGTNSDPTLAAYKLRVATRDDVSVSDLPNFVSSTDLHLTADNNCAVNGQAAPIFGFTDDYDALNSRDASFPDIGFDEFAGTNPVSLTVTDPAPVCTGNTVDLTAAAVTSGSAGGTVFYYYTDAGGTATLATPAAVATSGTYYIKYGKGSCYSPIEAVNVLVNPNNTWLGVTTDWNDADNWCPGIPGATSDITIPAGLSNYPIIPDLDAGLARNITIASGASITTTGTGYLEIKGNLVNNGTLLNWGEIRLTGSAPQSFPGGTTGTIGAMNTLTISNTSGANPAVDINRNLLIREVITPTQGIVRLDNAYITLRSTVDSTARVGEAGGSFIYNGTGNFVVERYYPGKRVWRLLTAPVRVDAAKTVFNSWQAGGNNTLTGNGTFVSGTGANPAVNGLDVSPLNNSSLKTFDYTTSSFLSVPNTRTALISGLPAGNSSALTDLAGYFMFIRGDRTPANVYAFNQYGAVLPTTLRDTGFIKTGTYTFACNPGTGTHRYTLIGNPYASPVDFAALTRNNVLDRFWAWDPNLNTVGGYVTLDGGGYTPVKVPLTSTGTVGQTQIIQSTQAFLVETTGASPTITFNETDKSAINNLDIFRPLADNRRAATTIASNIFLENANGSRQIADGVVSQFGESFSNDIDQLDAVKFGNVNETFSILSRNNHLSLERKGLLTERDTIFYIFSRNSARNYSFNVFVQDFTAENLSAYVEDRYLNKLTPVNTDGDTWVNFNVTGAAASAAKDRFRIIFKKLVQYTGINAKVISEGVMVNWNISSEFNIKHYEIERSTNGTSFEPAGIELSAGDAEHGRAYAWLDRGPVPGLYYYRIKTVGNNGAVAYSDKVKVTVVKSSPAMFVFPNPVTNNIIGLQMNKMPGGVYETVLTNESGSVINRNRVVHIGGTATESIVPGSALISGAYQLEVTGPDKKKTVLKVIVQTR